MARRLLHRALLLDPVGPSIEQKFDRQAAPRLHARLVEAMDDAHHVAAAIGTDPGRSQPKISVEPTLGAPEILLDPFPGTVSAGPAAMQSSKSTSCRPANSQTPATPIRARTARITAKRMATAPSRRGARINIRSAVVYSFPEKHGRFVEF